MPVSLSLLYPAEHQSLKGFYLQVFQDIQVGRADPEVRLDQEIPGDQQYPNGLYHPSSLLALLAHFHLSIPSEGKRRKCHNSMNVGTESKPNFLYFLCYYCPWVQTSTMPYKSTYTPTVKRNININLCHLSTSLSKTDTHTPTMHYTLFCNKQCIKCIDVCGCYIKKLESFTVSIKAISILLYAVLFYSKAFVLYLHSFKNLVQLITCIYQTKRHH